ncbi:ATP-binding protein [Thermoleptolyngbya sp. M55_K2018_002]|uniref:hybrid sensor histidine kinase/response regulator n=1 Tax=Thermoleptolyngbya sp. M55_K2018_002 TaxID=2747808 RepID=UPI0019E4D60A|nr:ATP-binding protein [Thermoleptolyngbya sp. M55_K2018_002]HIK41257.1 response regulator [Thermoleptolyngbya sp. M55_K2018_002]
MPPTRLLIVEDEHLIAYDLRESLERFGYEIVAIADTGIDAVRQSEQLRPDLVLMDIRLPGEMDGIDASAQIQTQLHIPVVYLTANADQATLERVAASHPYGYVLKPFNDRILATTIEIALARHRAETAAEAAQQLTEAEMQRRAEHLAVVSHEIRTPLMAIRACADSLQRYGNLLPPDKQQQHLQQIQTAAESLSLLLEDILLLERMHSDHLEFFPTPIDVASFCEEQVEVWRYTSDHQCELAFFSDGAPCITQLDHKLLWHVVNNLLSNAVKYSPEGGCVSLTVFCQPDTIGLQVKDEGIGIPPEALPQLFEPFHRASNVGEIPGTGLGLAIAKRCIDLHGGQISVESTLGEGTVFTVQLNRSEG